jgi:uncharacterized membrane protein
VGSWWEIISVFLLSSVKFVFGGVPLALVHGFSFFKAVVVTSLGGFTGVIVFVFLSDTIIKKVKDRRLKKMQQGKIEPTRKKIFSKKNRLIIHVKHRFGLLGIAVLTPLLFSIPVGCFLATRYFKDKQRILIYMFASILFWAVSVSSFRLLWA